MIQHSSKIIQIPSKVIHQSPNNSQHLSKIKKRRSRNIEKSSKINQSENIKKPCESVKKSSEIVKKPSEIVEKSSEIVKKSSKVVKKPTDTIEKPSDIMIKPSESIKNLCCSVQEPSENIEQPSKNIPKSYEIVQIFSKESTESMRFQLKCRKYQINRSRNKILSLLLKIILPTLYILIMNIISLINLTIQYQVKSQQQPESSERILNDDKIYDQKNQWHNRKIYEYKKRISEKQQIYPRNKNKLRSLC
eukprot:TCONS_00071704-protein